MSEFECPVQKTSIIKESTLADGSHLVSVPQPLRFAAGFHAHTDTVLYFSLSAPLTDYPSFISLFSLCASLSFCCFFYPARLLFIKKWFKHLGFHAKTTALLLHPPTSPGSAPRFPYSTSIRICLTLGLSFRLTTSGLHFGEALYIL